MKNRLLLVLAAFFLHSLAAAHTISSNHFEEIDSVEDTFDALCSDPDNTTEECTALRSQLYLEIAEELSAMQWMNIEENIEPAILALQLPDKEIQLKALLILGQWVTRPEVQKAVRPFLYDPNVTLAYYAARILQNSSEAKEQRLASQFLHNHPYQFSDTYRLFTQHDQPNYARLQLPKYPNSTPLELATIYRADYMGAGFSTTDSMEQVLAYFRQVTKQKELNQDDFVAQKNQWQQSGQDTFINHPKINEMQTLLEKYQKTPDPALMAQLDALGKEMATIINTASDQALFNFTPLSGQSDLSNGAGTRYFFTKTEGIKPIEMIIISPDEQLKQTIIQLVWTQKQNQD